MYELIEELHIIILRLLLLCEYRYAILLLLISLLFSFIALTTSCIPLCVFQATWSTPKCEPRAPPRKTTWRPSHVLKAIGLSDAQAKNSIRLGFGRYTTLAEIEEAAEKINAAAEAQGL